MSMIGDTRQRLPNNPGSPDCRCDCHFYANEYHFIACCTVSDYKPTVEVSGLALVLREIVAERKRQDKKWGDQRDHPDDTWFRILGEEFGEIAEALNEHRTDEELEAEIVQVAAVCAVWLESRRVHALSNTVRLSR